MCNTHPSPIVLVIIGKKKAAAKRTVCNVDTSKIFLAYSTNDDSLSLKASASNPYAHAATL